MMNIAVERLVANDATREWVRIVFADSRNAVASLKECITPEWQIQFISRIGSNQTIAVIAAVDGVAAGLFWGNPWENGIWSCHQVVMSQFRGFLAFRIAKACMDYAFETIPGIQCLMGIVPADNMPSIVVALKLGCKQIGLWPQFVEGKNGVILLKERDNHG